jgi:SOS-response transcriptional repressor LexA
MSYDQISQINKSDSTHTPVGGVSGLKPRRTISEKLPQFRKVAALSATLAERELGLPAGAWNRRRLFALRVLSGDLTDCGFSKGDFLIIEPGAASVPGRLIVVRAEDALELRRVARDRRDEVETTAPDGLPFPKRIRRNRIVGTVIGSLAKLPVRKPAGRSLPATNRAKSGPVVTVAPQLRAANADVLGGNLDRWTVWSSGVKNPALRRASDKLSSRLRVLSSCLEVASESQLYTALIGEVNKVLRAMKRTGSTPASPTLPSLRELLPPIGGSLANHPNRDPRAHNAHAA